MEDRCTEVLYLELSNAEPEQARARAAELARAPGAERVSEWENCVFGRTDLPKRIPDGRSLVVVEATGSFEEPTAPANASAAHVFRRHDRPSQGILTGNRTTGLLVVWISPRTPDHAGRLRDWGDYVHIRHIAAAGIPGFAQISVYENAAGTDPLYMHFYEFDAGDAETTFSTMVQFVAPRLGGGDSEAYADWADWRAAGGRLFYCNTFNRRNEPPGASS
jgi:hypothetical protein